MSLLPLSGISVVECSTGMAGRLAGLLLADQGATVIVCREGGEPAPLDAYLDRGKHIHAGAEPACSAGADVVIRDGTDNGERIHEQIRLAITAVLPGETAYPFPDEVGDDILKAVSGFYTDLAMTRSLLGDNVLYTPVPLCSVYAGVLGATAVGAALMDRLRSDAGRDIVISRLAAGLSSVGALALEVGGIPEHLKTGPIISLPPELAAHVGKARADKAYFEWLKRQMNPLFACYPAADDRQVMFLSVIHRDYARRLLETLGIWEDMQALGVVDLPIYDSSNAEYADHNIAVAQNLRLPLRAKLAELIAAAVARKPAEEWERILGEANIPCAMVRDFDEWRASDHARQSGIVETVGGCDWPQLGRAVRLASAKPYPALHIGTTGKTSLPASQSATAKEAAKLAAPLAGMRVVDLANVIAGPACGRMLAELGAEVIKVDSTQPEHAPAVTVVWPGELSQGKRSILLNLRQEDGREILRRLVAQADLVVFNKLDPVMKRLGLDRAGLARLNPDAIAVQLSAFKGERPGSHDDYPGYDPLLQAATGIMTRFGSSDAPELHGLASCVDYLTGYIAAFGAIVALFARERRPERGGDWVDTSLASAASFIQASFQVTPAPVGTANCLRKVKDGWICVEPADADIPGISELTVPEALTAAKSAGIIAAPVQSIAELKARHRENPSADVAFKTSSGDLPAFNLRQTWFHFDGSPLPELAAAPAPGANAQEILQELGYGAADIEKMMSVGTVGQVLWGSPSELKAVE
ncbi:CoA transferase [Paraburkholderia sp. GAS348]|uniref:CoA transferase n=1 Tax=Paraburkholderia sp. GAS348 TaxID=3035132 RepID=UPI003D1E7986